MNRNRLLQTGVTSARTSVRWRMYGGVAAVCVAWLSGCSAEPASAGVDATERTPAVPVRIEPARVTTLRPSVDLVGTVVPVPERMAVVTSQIDGTLRTVSVVEGAAVERGQTLFSLDTRRADAALAKADAMVSQRRAALGRLQHGYRPQEIEIAKQDAARAEAELESQRLRMAATTQLHDNQEVSDVQFNKETAKLRQVKAAYAAAAAKLDLIRAGTRPEALAEAQALLDVAVAERARAALVVDFGTLTSPIDGVLTQQLARPGMHVARADRLATVVDLSNVFVWIRVPSGYLSRVKKDARVEVRVASVDAEPWEGRIARFSGEADPSTGDLQAFALLANKRGLLRPGLACRVRVWLPSIADALVVPRSAVADRDGVAVLHVVRGNKAYEVRVSLGADTREDVQVINGLSPGDVVITRGGYGLPDGCPVEAAAP